MFDLHTEDDAAVGPTETSVTLEKRSDTKVAAVPGDARARCATCMMRNSCMAASLEAGEMSHLDSVVQGWRSVKQGERLYRAGDPFRSLYAVRAGSFKTVVTPSRGKETIAGFHMAGDSLGMDGVCQESHSCDAIGLEDSVVCVIPFHLLDLRARNQAARPFKWSFWGYPLQTGAS